MEALPQPIVFEMDVHCIDCANSIRRSLCNIFGATSVAVSTATGFVVVRGGSHLDPWTLKCFLQGFAETRHGGGLPGRSGVAIVNDGGRPHQGPQPQLYYIPNGHPGYDGSVGGCNIL